MAKSIVATVSLESGTNGASKGVRMATLDGSVRGPGVSGNEQSEAPNSAEDSKTFRPGRPMKRIVQAVLREYRSFGR